MDEDHMKRVLEEQLLNVNAAARARGVDRRTITSWMEVGLLKPLAKNALGQPLLRRGDVLAVVPPRVGRPPKKRTAEEGSTPPTPVADDDLAERTNQ